MKKIIKDLITLKDYLGKPCKLCGSKDIYVIHEPNPYDINNINADFVFCRCENCRYIPLKSNLWPKIDFTNVYEAVDYWNKKNRY